MSKPINYREMVATIKKAAQLEPILPPKGKPSLWVVDFPYEATAGADYTKIVRFDGKYVYLEELLKNTAADPVAIMTPGRYDCRHSITRLPQRVRDYLKSHELYQEWLSGADVDYFRHPEGPVPNMDF